MSWLRCVRCAVSTCLRTFVTIELQTHDTAVPYSSTTMSKHALLGQPAPVLSLPNADGTAYELKPGAEGKPTAVFFYPKAGAFTLSTAKFTVL